MSTVTLIGGWSPRDTALRARLAALARSAQTAGAEIVAPARRGFLKRFETRAAALVEERLAAGERIANCPAEVARVANLLLKLHMTELAHRPRAPKGSAKGSATTPAKKEQRPSDGNRRSPQPPITPRSRHASNESAAAGGLPPAR